MPPISVVKFYESKTKKRRKIGVGRRSWRAGAWCIYAEAGREHHRPIVHCSEPRPIVLSCEVREWFESVAAQIGWWWWLLLLILLFSQKFSSVCRTVSEEGDRWSVSLLLMFNSQASNYCNRPFKGCHSFDGFSCAIKSCMPPDEWPEWHLSPTISYISLPSALSNMCSRFASIPFSAILYFRQFCAFSTVHLSQVHWKTKPDNNGILSEWKNVSDKVTTDNVLVASEDLL